MMIQIEKKSRGSSIFREDAGWDTEIDGIYKVKIFGITLFSRKIDKKWDFADFQTTKQVGFKNGNQ